MMDFTDALDDELDTTLTRFATRQDLEQGIEHQTEAIKRYFAEQMARQRRWIFVIAVGTGAVTATILSILIAVT